jgi:uncharacterized membrane protein
MDSILIHIFHIDWALVGAQVLYVLFVSLLVWCVVLRDVVVFVEKRRKRIMEQTIHAERAEQILQDAYKKRTEILAGKRDSSIKLQ